MVTTNRPQRRGVLLLLLALALIPFTLPKPAMAQDGASKVVYHVDFGDPRRFSAMLTSIHNMVTHYNNEFLEYDVRVVLNAHGIRFVTDDPLKDTPFEEDEALKERRDNLKGRLATLMDLYGVRVELCNITRKEIGVAKDKVYESVEYVPSGVVRIAELQQKGFAYLKTE